MGLGSAIGAVGSIVGGFLGRGAANKAASQQQQQQQQQLQFLQQVYGQGQQNLSPFIGAGQAALPTLLGFYGLPGGNASGAAEGFKQFQQTPFYQFPFQQGMLGVNRALAASGLIGSGAQLKDASQFTSGLASQALSPYLAGLSGLVGSGQNAATSLMSGGLQTGQLTGPAYTAIGNAQAAGTVGGMNDVLKGFQGAMAPAQQFTAGLFGQPAPGGQSSSAYMGGQNVGNWASNLWNSNFNSNNSLYYGSNYNYDPTSYGYKAGSPSTFGFPSLNGSGQ